MGLEKTVAAGTISATARLTKLRAMIEMSGADGGGSTVIIK